MSLVIAVVCLWSGCLVFETWLRRSLRNCLYCDICSLEVMLGKLSGGDE